MDVISYDSFVSGYSLASIDVFSLKDNTKCLFDISHINSSSIVLSPSEFSFIVRFDSWFPSFWSKLNKSLYSTDLLFSNSVGDLYKMTGLLTPKFREYLLIDGVLSVRCVFYNRDFEFTSILSEYSKSLIEEVI